MPKGPKITESIKFLIASIHKEYPDYVAKEVTRELHERLHSNHPGLSAVQKVLAQMKENYGKENNEDDPWSIAKLALKTFPISPDALPTVLRVQRLLQQPTRPFTVVLDMRKFFELPTVFTVRDAKWVAQFSALVPYHLPDYGLLASVALSCSMFEKICEITESRFDSTVIEDMLLAVSVKPRDKKIKDYTDMDWDEHYIRFERFFVETMKKLMATQQKKEQERNEQ